MLAFERCVISKGVKTLKDPSAVLDWFERCVISKGVKTDTGGTAGNL